MLDSETKRRIDACRDILVGKVPDPKSQVEQITIALIYKFMDDMDAEAEELGSKRSFFAGDYARFGWARVMVPAHQDIGQMDMYVRMYDDLKRGEGDNPAVGILLCEHKDESVVRYSVLNDSKPLFASKYRLVLPSEDELRQEIASERAVLEGASHLQDEAES